MDASMRQRNWQGLMVSPHTYSGTYRPTCSYNCTTPYLTSGGETSHPPPG